MASDFDYTDDNKAIAHDQERYLWEGESGFVFMDSDDPIFPATAEAVSDAFEYGFSAGWDRAVKSLGVSQ